MFGAVSVDQDVFAFAQVGEMATVRVRVESATAIDNGRDGSDRKTSCFVDKRRQGGMAARARGRAGGGEGEATSRAERGAVLRDESLASAVSTREASAAAMVRWRAFRVRRRRARRRWPRRRCARGAVAEPTEGSWKARAKSWSRGRIRRGGECLKVRHEERENDDGDRG